MKTKYDIKTKKKLIEALFDVQEAFMNTEKNAVVKDEKAFKAHFNAICKLIK